MKLQITVKDVRGDRVLKVESGENLRACLLAEELSPYQGSFRTLNCRGMGICGSCSVRVLENGEWWPRRSCQIRCFQDMEIELQ